jgi:hypothetical protein
MANRKRLSSHRPDCTISVVTEERPDQTWSVVANIDVDRGSAVEVIPVPLVEGAASAFSTEEEACAYAREAAEQWINRNMPGTESGEPASEG